ncbi:MAG TPA: beta-ketoacyl synthase N-terminal-like domain-containing protein [Nitrospirota bacterium]
MNILGIGMIFSRGLGIACFEKALQDGWRKPGEIEVAHGAGRNYPVYLAGLETVQGKTLLKKIRRSDKLAKMSALAAADALVDGGIGGLRDKRVGVIIATAFGAHVTTFSFLDDILDYGDAAVSPTTFSNSVHNAAASYVSLSLDIQGPTLTVTQFQFSFQAAMQLAQTWLDQGRCDYLLVGAVDQYGDVLRYVADRKLAIAEDGKIKPFAFNPTCYVPGEGAVFFLLSGEDRGKSYCRVDAVHTYDDPLHGKPVDINIIDADGMLPDESAYLPSLSPDIPSAAYSPLFGSMMIGSAFNAAAGALMIKRQTRYASPVQDNPHGICILTETGEARIEAIRCMGIDCSQAKSAIYLTSA